MTSTPKTLNVTECHQLLDALLVKEGTAKQFRKGLRNYTMALLMLDAGLRVGEVVRLKQTDLYFSPVPVKSLRVREEISKGKTERIVPLGDRARRAVNEMYTNLWQHEQGHWGGFAFYQHNPSIPMTTRQVERIINAAAMKSLGRPVHPHVLRHTFATRLMRVTNERIVQELLGHKHIGSTMIYTHPNEDDKKRAIESIENVPPIGLTNPATNAPLPNFPDRSDTPGADGDVR